MSAGLEVVLVVDDNQMNQDMMRLLLQREGFTVHQAYDADEAMALLQVIRPPLVLMDIQLPGKSGLALTREIRADPVLRGTVVVAVTAYAMAGDEQRCLAAGCDGYLSKPLDVMSFAASVRAFRDRAAPPVNPVPPVA